MVSFELGKEIKKNEIWFFQQHRTKKNSESPWGIEPQTFRFWRSEVQFLMGTQNFFFVPRCWKNKNHLSLKITLFICALITKGNVSFSLKKDLKSILFQLYFIITLYESLLVFFFWSRNEWSNVGLLLSKNIHLIVSQDLLREQFLQCSKSCTWTIWIIISTLKISLCVSDITSATHAVQIHF